MKLVVNPDICLESITKETTEALYPLFMEDISELNRWFGFDADYSIENDYRYLDSRNPPYDDAIVVFYRGTPCGRFGLYGYEPVESSLYMYYWISTRFRRKGIAIGAMGPVLEYLRYLAVREVMFDVDRENYASIELLRKYPGIYLKSEGKHLIFACGLQAGRYKNG